MNLNSKTYFLNFRDRHPPTFSAMSAGRTAVWHTLAGVTIGLGLWYLHWRWTASLNADALTFSIAVASAETAAFLGTLLFFFDIWREQDTPQSPPPERRADAGLDGEGSINVDLFITTFDEGVEVVEPTIKDALDLAVPSAASLSIFVLDDGHQPGMPDLAKRYDVEYLARSTNRGFKAGNLRNAIMQTRGDFVVICDADTSLFPSFLENTLGYFRDPKVAWVQTPHWFYDIPDVQPWSSGSLVPNGWLGALSSRILSLFAGKRGYGADPFLSDPTVFFDVIQRRRNRNSASFCCGAGSIHRREAVLANALGRQAKHVRQVFPKGTGQSGRHQLRACELQPFAYHVSEDILTSIHLHREGWKSVYHPQVEARMLSPWSIKAWAMQRLKYAGGTYDIMINDNPIFGRGMSIWARLHYAATFWSYLSVLWLPILLFAPVLSLLTGLAPVEAYSAEFFWHLLPLLLVNELALHISCKGYDTHGGRALAASALPIQLRAIYQVLRGEKPTFPATPKVPGKRRELRYAKPALVSLSIMAAAATWGSYATWTGIPGYSLSLLVVNLFWLAWNSLALMRVVQMSLWSPPNLAGSYSTLIPSTTKSIGGVRAEPS
ncbi:MAG: glycosyltransferase [Pseudomonadota bacterium]